MYNIYWDTRTRPASDAADETAILKDCASDWPTSEATLRSQKNADRLSRRNETIAFDINTFCGDQTPRNLLQAMNRICFVTDFLGIDLFVCCLGIGS